MALQPGTNKQIPDHAILDAYNKQTYLGNQFIASLKSPTVGTSETPILYLANPAVTTSAFPSNWLSLFHNFRKMTCLTATQNVLFRFYFNPTGVSGGTPVVPVNLRTGSATTSIATVLSAPTVVTNGTYLAELVSLAFTPDVSTVLSIIDPNTSLLVTATASAASTAYTAEIGWYEL